MQTKNPITNASAATTAQISYDDMNEIMRELTPSAKLAEMTCDEMDEAREIADGKFLALSHASVSFPSDVEGFRTACLQFLATL